MEWLAALVVQLAVGVLTLSISLELKARHFAAAMAAPRDLGVGLAAQLAILPLLVLLLSTTLQDATVLTALCLVAFTPSGPTSNYLAHLAQGDVALAIVLTIVGTLLSAVAMPLALPALLQFATGDELARIVTPLAVFRGLLGMVIVPLLLGLYAARRWPAGVARVQPAISRIAAVLFVLLVAAAIASQWQVLVRAVVQAGVPVLAVNAAALALGALAGRAAGLAQPRRTTLALKVGVQNVSIALGVAIGVLGRLDVAAVAALYGVTQLLVASAYAAACRRRHRPASPVA
ncbi:bile acid:sodium symporter family protein [Ramlibacter sp.]|uniref:bile acid:sodium symporter family protein n=1 Tax=Ramlibacter sp. TaxID=1917967 RepID=UPI002FCC5B46